MPAFAPPFTGRIRISYHAARAVHTQVWRYPGPSSGSGVTDCLAAINDYYTALLPGIYDDFIVNSVSVADIDSEIFLPITNPFSTLGGDLVMADFEPEEKANQMIFVGRTTGGNPWHVSQFGVAFPALQAVGSYNFRVLRGENVNVTAALDALQAAAGIIIGNDSNAVAFYDYANVKPNNEWVKKVRRGG